MKLFSIVLIVVITSSCQKPKNWDCTCDYNNLNGSGTTTYHISNKKQNDANSTCNQYGASLATNGTSKCKLTAN